MSSSHDSPEINQRIKRVLKKLTKNQKIFFWLRLILWLVAYRARRYVAGIFIPPRSRAHWIGYARRTPRPERLAMVLLFFVAMILLEPREYVLWSISAGSGASLFLILTTIYRLVPRRRAHWVRQK